MGLNLHALALRCALGKNGETEKALASLVLNVFPRKTQQRKVAAASARCSGPRGFTHGVNAKGDS